MIKSETNLVIHPVKKQFPALYKGRDTGNILLATGMNERNLIGVLLLVTDDRYNVCESSTNWKKDAFELFDGTITLSNE